MKRTKQYIALNSNSGQNSCQPKHTKTVFENKKISVPMTSDAITSALSFSRFYSLPAMIEPDMEVVMPEDVQKDILFAQLKEELGTIGKHLNELMRQVLKALENRDTQLAAEALPLLQEFQNKEDASREICLQILAQTEGNIVDKEWVNCVHKVLVLMGQSSLEIFKIAQKVAALEANPELPLAKDLPVMGKIASQMLQQSIWIVLQPDVEKACQVMENDSSLDRYKNNFSEKAIAFMMENSEILYPVMPYLHISKHLEKIGDHASHIAEEVAYYLREQIQ